MPRNHVPNLESSVLDAGYHPVLSPRRAERKHVATRLQHADRLARPRLTPFTERASLNGGDVRELGVIATAALRPILAHLAATGAATVQA